MLDLQYNYRLVFWLVFHNYLKNLANTAGFWATIFITTVISQIAHIRGGQVGGGGVGGCNLAGGQPEAGYTFQ